VRLGVEVAKAQSNAEQRLSEAEEKATLERARLSAEVAKTLLDDDRGRERE
jgi:hypothetical protein